MPDALRLPVGKSYYPSISTVNLSNRVSQLPLTQGGHDTPAASVAASVLAANRMPSADLAASTPPTQHAPHAGTRARIKLARDLPTRGLDVQGPSRPLFGRLAAGLGWIREGTDGGTGPCSTSLTGVSPVRPLACARTAGTRHHCPSISIYLQGFTGIFIPRAIP
jgi:hypothetical protein